MQLKPPVSKRESTDNKILKKVWRSKKRPELVTEEKPGKKTCKNRAWSAHKWERLSTGGQCVGTRIEKKQQLDVTI